MSMNEWTSGDSVQVTTETDCGQRNWRGQRATAYIFGLLCLVLAVAIVQMRGEPWVRAFLVGIMGFGGVFFFATPTIQLRRRGVWTLGCDGILFKPIRGEPRYFRWIDIDAVRFGSRSVLIRSAGMATLLNLEHEATEHRQRVRDFIRIALSPAFDLSERSLPKFSLRRVVVGTLAGAPLALVPLVGAYVQTTFLDPERRWASWGPLWCFVWLIPLMLGLYCVGRQQDKLLWRYRDGGK